MYNICIYIYINSELLVALGGRVSDLDFQRFHNFKSELGMKLGTLSLVRAIEYLLD